MFIARRFFSAAACLTVFACYTLESTAAIQSYTNQGAWQSAAGPTIVETFDSSPVAPFPGAPGAGAIPSQAFNGFSVSGSYNGDYVGIASGGSLSSINGTKSLTWVQHPGTPGWGGPAGNGGIGPLVTLTFDSPILSLGFLWEDTDGSDSYTLEVPGQSAFTNPPFVTSGSGVGFFGIVSDTPFTTVNFRSTRQGGVVGSFSIDNVQTGGGVVPEPTTLLVWSLLGTTGVVVYRRKAMA